jgi:hypothetical protein
MTDVIHVSSIGTQFKASDAARQNAWTQVAFLDPDASTREDQLLKRASGLQSMVLYLALELKHQVDRESRVVVECRQEIERQAVLIRALMDKHEEQERQLNQHQPHESDAQNICAALSVLFKALN